MKKIIALLLFFHLFVYGETNATDTTMASDSSYLIKAQNKMLVKHAESLPLFVPLTEVLVQNSLIWAWDRYVLGVNYAKISPQVWKRNIENGWTWDNNHFGINFFGHPLQGVFYHGAARASGLSFYPSVFYDMLGSFTWEFFCENEYPSLNDFITTSYGGAFYGEILFRLSERLLAKSNPTWIDYVGAFILQPYTFIHHRISGTRPNNPGYFPIELSVFSGAGLRFGSDYRYDKAPAERLNDKWEELFGFAGLNLIYGSPKREMQKPFEYFTIHMTQEMGQKERLFNLEVLAKLKNINKISGSDWFDFASYTSYDVFYGDLVEMSAFSLGLGTDFMVALRPNLSFRLMSIPSFVVLGSTDFNYDDLLKEFYPDYEPTRTYQLNYGVHYKAAFEITAKHGRVSNNTNIFLLKTMPSSAPHYGANGWDVVGFNISNIDFFLTNHINLGLNLKFYFKIAAYEGEYFEPMSRTMESFGFYVKYLF